ncbi:MAG TPA: hypothetical protein VGG01_22405 [Xanthobacteraceae bacterium]|jgi:hypothetical protein
MGRLPKLFRVGSKLVLEILPSVAATVIGGYLLAQMHFGHSTEPPAQPPIASTQPPTVGQDRATIHEVLKERRERPEKPAQVRAAATAIPASTPAAAPARTARIPTGMDSIGPREPMAPSRPSLTAAVAVPAVAPPLDAETEVYVPAPPPGLPPAPPRGMDAPTVIVPSVATAAPPPAATAPSAPPPATALSAPAPADALPTAAAPSEPADHRGGVFSTFSSFVGHAANATGHTVNWVIDLPGKAISAGGRAIGVNSPPPAPPQQPRPLS